jgi:hypothetical protein
MLTYILTIYEYYYGLGGIGYWVLVFLLSAIVLTFTLLIRSKHGRITKPWIFASAISIILFIPTIIFKLTVKSNYLISYINYCCPLPIREYETIPSLTYNYEIFFLFGLGGLLISLSGFIFTSVKKPYLEILSIQAKKPFNWIAKNREEKRISNPIANKISDNIDMAHSSPQVKKTPANIFICYRRQDSGDVTGRILDRLSAQFGRDKIFLDVHKIPLGMDFRKAIDDEVSKCKTQLVVIGDQWLSMLNEEGMRRVDDPNDFVRIEIESALRRDIPVIPLLVRDAKMPSADELPAELENLAYRNGIKIRPDPDFHHDMDRLIEGLEEYLYSSDHHSFD